MNWIQPKFTDFLVPPCKKPKLDKNLSADRKEPIPSVSSSCKADKADDARLPYKPRTRNDLVVNKKKIEEIESWLNGVNRKGRTSILLLTGPPGSGKLTTLKVLCSEMKINIIEWLPQINSRTFDPDNVGSYQSVASQFDDFLSRATRYSNVLNAMSSRLVVVKDVPNCFIRDPASFHKLLVNYSQVTGVHLALILTDISLARSLIPEHIKSSLPLTIASFNPVTQKGVKDALKKQFPSKYAQYIDGVAASCNGDLRQAITSFEFLAKNGVTSTAKKKSSEPKMKSSKEDFVDIFHGLGRVLYSKREPDGKLVHDPVEIGESFASSPELFTGMLHENYLNTFSSVHDVAAAIETLSMADTLLSDFKDSLASRSLSSVIASSGFMLRNSAPIKKFQQMNKPRKIDNVLTEFRSKFADTNVLLDTVSLGRLIPSFAQENSYLLSQLGKLK